MNKQLISLIVLMGLVGASSCSAMDARRSIKLFIDDPAVKILIPNHPDVYTITGEAFQGTTFFAPDADIIGIRFPGENESHYFNLMTLGLTGDTGDLIITVIKSGPNTYGVQLENPITHAKAFYLHGDDTSSKKDELKVLHK